MKTVRPLHAFIVGSLLLSGGRAFSQDPAQQPQAPTIRVTSRLVVLDVVVLDKSGKPVRNLDRSQFSVTENKVPQAIRNFDPPSGHEMPAGSAAAPIVHSTADLAKIGNAPVNILVFDELNTKWEATAYARDRMEKYLKQQPEVLPVPTLLVAAGNSRFVVLHDYTQSRQDLLDAVKKHFPEYPWQMMKGNSGNNAIDLMGETLGALSQIAESSRGTPGRKNVIWVGSGYPTVDTTGLMTEDEDKLMDIIKMVTSRMLEARITLYMVEPSGVQGIVQDEGVAGDDGSVVSTSIASVGPYSGNLDFSTFAKATGGEVFFNRNDIDVAIKESVQDGNVYYTLAYTPTGDSTEQAAYRKIKVKVNDPSLRVVARDGYFSAPPPVEKVPVNGAKPSKVFTFDMVSASQNRLVYNALKVHPKATKDGYTLYVGTKELHWEVQPDGSRQAEVSVLTAFFNAKDKELAAHTVEIKQKIAANESVAADSVVAFHLPMEVPETMLRVRFVVRDAVTGIVGTADAK